MQKGEAIALYGVEVLADLQKGKETAFTRSFILGDGYTCDFKQVSGRMGAVRVYKAGSMTMPLWIAATTWREGETLAKAAVTALGKGETPDRGVYRPDGELPLLAEVA